MMAKRTLVVMVVIWEEISAKKQRRKPKEECRDARKLITKSKGIEFNVLAGTKFKNFRDLDYPTARSRSTFSLLL